MRHRAHVIRAVRRGTLPALFAFSAMLACEEHAPTEPADSDPVPTLDVIVSDARVSPLQAAGTTASAAATYAYVSLPPGSVAGGDAMRIRNLSEPHEIVVALVDGGVDPVPVPAIAGDRLELSVLAGDRVVAQALVVVAARRKPRVVRTEPPRGKRDVPLNASVAVVFNEPMDARSLDSVSLRIVRHGETVPLTIRPGADGLTVQLVPDAPLEPNALHTLQVSSDALDESGDPLESAIAVEFETGSATLPAFEVVVSDPTESALVHVSIRPGVVGSGTSVRIRNRAMQLLGEPALVNGGLDPFAIPAQVGDTIDLLAMDGAEAIAQATAIVPARRAPSVVRTDPSDGTTGVSAATVPLVVFSEPMSAATMTGATMGVRFGDSVVAGTIATDDDALVASFEPDQPLAAQNWYALHLTGRIADLDGDSLPPAGPFIFRTASTGSLPRIEIVPAPMISMWRSAGGWAEMPLHAEYIDRAGNATPVNAAWSISDPTIAEIESGRKAVLYEYGTAVITASANGVVGSTTITLEPEALRSLSLGVNGYACFLSVDARAYCRGDNELGSLGLGYADTAWSGYSYSPVRVATPSTFQQISSGWYHSCALEARGAIYCWGDNRFGQIGIGASDTIAPAPRRVAEGLSFVQVASGWFFSCGLTTAGEVYCWGEYGYQTIQPGHLPARVPADIPFARISAGSSMACGLSASGDAYCWGAGFMGDGTGGRTSFSPVPVAGGHSFTAISAGLSSCGVTAAGDLYCWGANDAGRFEADAVTEPVLIDLPDELHFIDVQSSDMLTCGLTAEGEVWCWGWTWPCSWCDAEPILPQRLDGVYEAVDTTPYDGVCAISIEATLVCRDLLSLLPGSGESAGPGPARHSDERWRRRLP